MPVPSPSPARNQAAGLLESRFSKSGRWRSRWRRLFAGFRWSLVIATASAAKRALDLLFAAVLLLAASPVFLAAGLAYLVKRPRTGIFARTVKVGRWCEEFGELSFTPELGGLWRSRPVRHIPIALNVLKGEMSLVGPRAASPGEMSPRQRRIRRRYDVRPGVICLWWVRRRANIAYETEADLDAEYVESHSPMRDLGIALRALPAVLYGEGVASAPDVLHVLDIRLENLTMSEAIEWMADRMRGELWGRPPGLPMPQSGKSDPEGRGYQVCFVNPDCANISARDEAYRQVLSRSALVLADGIGLKIAGKLLGTPIKQNVNGTDLFPRLMQTISGTGLGVYLLGARPGVPDLVAAWIQANYPDVRIAGYHHGYFNASEEETVIAGIRNSGADLLLVAFGAPRQDIWIDKHLGESGVKVAMGVGGLFDFYSGRIPRAPVWMREIGMEWFYRFIQEPRRMWRRYFVGNAVFLWRVMRQRSKSARTQGSAA